MKRVWCLDLPLLRTSHNTPKKSPSDTDNLFWRCGGLLASCRSICFRHDMRQPILKIRILPNNLITSLQTQRSFALYASYFTRHHMSTNSNSKNPSIFGNICHVTAIEQSDPNIAVEADGEVAQKRRLWLHQLVANLLRRCSIRRSSGHSVGDRCPLSECAHERANVTPPQVLLHNHPAEHQTPDHCTALHPARAISSGSDLEKGSTVSPTAAAPLNTEAWKLSLVLPFMDYPPS